MHQLKCTCMKVQIMSETRLTQCNFNLSFFHFFMSCPLPIASSILYLPLFLSSPPLTPFPPLSIVFPPSFQFPFSSLSMLFPRPLPFPSASTLVNTSCIYVEILETSQPHWVPPKLSLRVCANPALVAGQCWVCYWGGGGGRSCKTWNKDRYDQCVIYCICCKWNVF